MDIPRFQFGTITFSRVKNSAELKQLLVDPCFNSQNIIIKPNWVSTEPGDFTDAETLRVLLEALDARLFVTESYCLPRSMNIRKEGVEFIAKHKPVSWKWLLTGEGWDWLSQQENWDWFKNGSHWEQLKQEDSEFLDKYGFTDLFREYNVTYINVTEEVWNVRSTDPAGVKQAVEARFKPVQSEELYSLVPQALYDLRGSTFISLAKLKMYASFTFKNMFGMIPDPIRPRWHGSNGSRIVQSIIDINKIYHSLFNIFGICEALNCTTTIHPAGQFKGIYSGRYNLGAGKGVVVMGENLVALDRLLLHLSDPTKRDVAEFNRKIIELAEAEFGRVEDKYLAESDMRVRDWV